MLIGYPKGAPPISTICFMTDTSEATPGPIYSVYLKPAVHKDSFAES